MKNSKTTKFTISPACSNELNVRLMAGQTMACIPINLLFLCHLIPVILTLCALSLSQWPQADAFITKNDTSLVSSPNYFQTS